MPYKHCKCIVYGWDVISFIPVPCTLLVLGRYSNLTYFFDTGAVYGDIIMPPAASSTPHGSVKIKVLYFAKARELADGVSEEVLTFNTSSPANVNLNMAIEECTRLHTKLETLVSKSSGIALAVNMEYVNASSQSHREGLVLVDGDEVAFIPPISGG